MVKERTLTILGRYENVPRVTEFVVQAAAEAGLDEKAIFHCQMAVDEACTNIIEHAYGGEDKGSIQATTRVEPGVCTITLIDQGRPFDPSSVPKPAIDPDPANVEPGGLGLHLMRQIMDEVTFTFGKGRNKLVMVKRQPASSG
jgi:serine/threonine-protein kinase RsbW